MGANRSDAQYMFLSARELGVAVPCERVRRLLPLGAVRKPPGGHPLLRGWVEAEGRLHPAVDLRRAFDRQGRDEELREQIKGLEARREDHIRWLAELEASVRERRPFTLQTDPRLCAFGRWHATFTTDDPLLRVKLLAFDRPHRRIHALASEAFTLVDAGRADEALAMLDRARDGELADMLRLFPPTIELLANATREIVALCSYRQRTFALIADDAIGVGELGENALDTEVFDQTRGSLASAVVRRDGLATLVLDLDRLDASLARA